MVYNYVLEINDISPPGPRHEGLRTVLGGPEVRQPDDQPEPPYPAVWVQALLQDLRGVRSVCED